MPSLRNIPIKQKLMIIVMTTTIAALVLAGLGIVTFDLILYRANLKRDLSALARIIADNSTAALSFNDPNSAAETLAALRARPHLESACIYRGDGSLLATYQRAGSPSACALPGGNDGVLFGGQDVRVSQAILLNGRRIGTLMLVYDLEEILERLQLFGAIVLGVLLVSILIAFLLSSALQTTITTPILQLVYAATSVSQTGNYSIRTPKISDDESACWWIGSMECWPASKCGIFISEPRSASGERRCGRPRKLGSGFASWRNRCPKKSSPQHRAAWWIT